MPTWTHQSPLTCFSTAAKFVSEDDRDEFKSWEQVKPETREMLLKAVVVAPDMVTSAIHALEYYLSAWRQKCLEHADPRGEEVWIGCEILLP
jgi:hypothetical protein